MTSNQRRTVGVAMGLLLLAASVGCSGLWTEPTPTPEPVTLRFLFSQRSKQEKYQQAADEFHQKHPQITVEVVPVRDGNIVRPMGSGGADVVEAEQFDFPVLQQREALLELTPFLDSTVDFPKEDFYPRLWDLYRDQGRTWGIPANVDPMVLFYNKELFDQAGVVLPKVGWDWNDFLMAAQQLSWPDDPSPRYGFQPDPYGIGLWAFIYQGGGQLVDDMTKPTRAMLDDPRVIDAVEWYVALANEHRVMPVVTYSSGNMWQSAMDAINYRRVAMWMLLLSERGGKNQRNPWPFEWGVVPLPHDEARVTFMIASGYFVSAGTTYPEESWLWLRYLVEEADLAWDVPPRRSIAESGWYRERVGEEVFAVTQETAEYGMTLPAAAWLTQIPAQSAGLIDQMMLGRKTAQEGLIEMQQQWDAAIQSLSSK